MNGSECPDCYGKYWRIPITAMPRYCYVLVLLADVLSTLNADAKEQFEHDKTQYRDDSIQPVFNPDL